ncbi:MAG: DUF4231 domain-containing protein [Cyanobacteriota bacterium]|nr:DUF4231 domain-containing protein [Cyanobacteriota bacterium]
MAMDSDTYLTERVDKQLTWLGSKSRASKAAFMRYRLMGILLGALITVLSPYAGRTDSIIPKDWISPALQVAGVGVALSGAVLALHRHQENWLRYRSLKEAMEREKMLYLTGSTEAYASPEGFHHFVRTMEDLMASERNSWSRQTTGKENTILGPLPSAQRPSSGEEPPAQPEGWGSSPP